MKKESQDTKSIQEKKEIDSKNVREQEKKEDSKAKIEQTQVDSVSADIPMPYEAKVALVITVAVICFFFLVFFTFAVFHLFYFDERAKIYIHNPSDQSKFMTILRSEHQEDFKNKKTFLQNLGSFLDMKIEKSFPNSKNSKKDTILIFVPDFYGNSSSFAGIMEEIKKKNVENGGEKFKNLEMVSFSYRGQASSVNEVPIIAKKMGFDSKIKKTRIMDLGEDLEFVVNNALRDHDKRNVKLILIGQGIGGFVVEKYLQNCVVNANCPDSIMKIGSFPLQRTKYFWNFMDFGLIKDLYSKQNMLLAYFDYLFSRMVDERSISMALWKQKKDSPAIQNCVSIHSSQTQAWNEMEKEQFLKAKPFFCAKADSILMENFNSKQIAQSIENLI